MRTTPAALAPIRDALRRHGRVLVRDAFLDASAITALLRALSDETRDPFAAGLGAARRPLPQPVEPHPGSPALPLHRDGALIDRPSKLIAFTALEASSEGNLETVDSSRALTELSPALALQLEGSSWEYRLRDRGPFTHLPEGWFSRPTFVDDTEPRALNTILPERDGATPQPWQVRLQGSSVEASRAFFTAVDAALRATSSFTSHSWHDGDLIVIDNDRILHGITAIPQGSRHRVVRASS